MERRPQLLMMHFKTRIYTLKGGVGNSLQKHFLLWNALNIPIAMNTLNALTINTLRKMSSVEAVAL